MWERLDRAGARFIAVGDGIDSASAGSEMLFAIKAAIAREQWKRYQANWLQAKKNAIDRGVHIGCKPPLGYLRGDDGRLTIDHKTADFVQEIFTKRMAGVSWAELSRWTREEGRTVTASGLRKLVANPVYLGQVQHGQDYVNLSAHEPIVSRRVFDLTNAAVMTGSRRGRTGRVAGKTIAQGLARCSACGLTMKVHLNTHGRLALQCRNALCDVPNSIQAEPLDAEIIERVMALLSGEDVLHGPMDETWAAERGVIIDHPVGPMFREEGRRPPAMADAEKALQDAEYDLDIFLAQTDALRTLGAARWNDTLALYAAKVEDAKSRLLKVQSTAAVLGKVSMFDETWDSWSHEERRGFVHALVLTALVFPANGKRGVPVAARVMLQVADDPERWI